MNTIRHDKISGQWVIIAPNRGQRPKDFKEDRVPREPSGGGGACPFCPSNEGMLPGVIMELGQGAGEGGWQTRVVPNKFPALKTEESLDRITQGIYLAMGGYGRHEVVIESPQHEHDLVHMSRDQVETVIETYQSRYQEIMQAEENMLAIIFRNHGPKAGTSLKHPHSQIVATSIVPRHIRWRENESQRYFDQWGRCVICDILDYEQEERVRVILENDSFLAFVPFAARVPFEVQIVPRRHKADFGSITAQERGNLASALREVLRRLHRKLDDPDYNYVVQSAPQNKAGEPHLHWYLQIQPRLTTRAGFEIGSGMRVNPSLPEEDAEKLQE